MCGLEAEGFEPFQKHDKGSRTPLLIASCIFIFAFILRLVFALQWQDMPYGTSPLLDAQGYDEFAQSLAAGHGAGGDAFYQSPLYPYLLSLLYRTIGHSYFAVSILNAVLDSFTCALLSLITFSLFGRLASILSGILAATFLPMIFFTAPPMKEPLELFLFAGFVFSALHLLRANRLRDYLLCGFVLGLTILARGNALLLVPVVPILAYRHYKRLAWPGIAVFCVSVILPIVPVTYHNFSVTQDFVPITYDEGFNLYIGHSPYANGINAYPPELSTSPSQEKLDVVMIAERESGRKLSPSGVSAYWRSQAIDYALTHPVREVQLFFLKLFAFWSDVDDIDNYDTHFIEENFSSLLNLPLTRFGMISVLAAFTVCGGVRRLSNERTKESSLFLLSCTFVYMFSLVIFYITDRYRLPVIVFLIPLAGAALPCGLMWIKEKKKRNLLDAGLGCLIFLGLALHAPSSAVDLRAFNWGVLTSIYADKGDAKDTFTAFQKGVAVSGSGIGPQAYIRVAEMYEKEGQIDFAGQLVRRAVEIFPQNGAVLYNQGRMEALQGNIDEALKTLHKAQKLSPDYCLIYFALAKIYEKKGDKTKAKEALYEGLAIDPRDPNLMALVKEQEEK